VKPPAPTPYDPAAARALLARAGWADSDGDGILDKGGRPLALSLAIPNTSMVRQLLAQAAERQWRAIGVQLTINASDFPTFISRYRAGDFDMTIASATQDPSPSGLSQSWSCAGMGGSNAAHYCNPRIDSLLERARFGGGDPRDSWRELLRTVEEDAPAAFVYAPALATVVSRRLGRVRIRPESLWSGIWEWTVEDEPGASR
jgi:peptide/nickel transport system substrate-binding protein